MDSQPSVLSAVWYISPAFHHALAFYCYLPLRTIFLQVAIDSDFSSDEDETYEMKPRAMKMLATDLMYPMIDFQTHLNVDIAKNIV